MAWDQSDPNCWVRAATATGNIYSEEDAAKKTPRSQLYKMITCSGCNQHTGETVWASYDAIVNRVYHDTCSPDEDFFCFMCEANPKKEIDKKTKSTTCPSCAHTAPYEEAKAGQPCALTAGCNGILNTMPDRHGKHIKNGRACDSRLASAEYQFCGKFPLYAQRTWHQMRVEWKRGMARD